VVAGETDVDPEVPEALKPPPVQDVALVELQVSVDDCPDVIEVGLAESEAVGAGTVTVTVAYDVGEVPPGPVQVTP